MVSVSGATTPQAGTTTTLDCSSTAGNPAATNYEWKKSGNVVQASSGMSSYTFTPDATDNGQTLTCTASNGVGADRSGSMSLVVYSECNVSNMETFHGCYNFVSGLPSLVFITNNISHYPEGGTANLFCIVIGGNPAPPTMFTWSQGGTVLAEMTNQLTLTLLTRANDGEAIVCSATNDAGTVTSAASTLTVQCE